MEQPITRTCSSKCTMLTLCKQQMQAKKTVSVRNQTELVGIWNVRGKGEQHVGFVTCS